jgi:uncharacterized Rossmann fold enzyme
MSVLSPLYWSEVYEAIRAIMHYNRAMDCEASRVANRLAYDAMLQGRFIAIQDICGLLKGKSVCIAGGSESLMRQLDALSKCERIIAVDGASMLLLENSIDPDIVVSDLDGPWNYLLKASQHGAYMVVHVHGDNISAVKHLAPMFKKIVLTTQCLADNSYFSFLPGFTDGERAIGLALICDATSIVLAGMRTWERVGYWSKPWLSSSVEPWTEKKRKLSIAEFFIQLFSHYAKENGVKWQRL